MCCNFTIVFVNCKFLTTYFAEKCESRPHLSFLFAEKMYLCLDKPSGMSQRFTYSIPPHALSLLATASHICAAEPLKHTLSFPATADCICVAEPRPHTYGEIVRADTRDTRRWMVNPLMGITPAHRTSLGYRYVSPNGETLPFRITPTHTDSPTIVHYSLYIVHCTYTFSAKEKDPETGLSYFGSRYYSSDLSIWLSVDPMAAKYPSLSPYVYCADNPVRCVDPNGEEIDDNLDKWKYNKTTGKLDWISNEGGRCHQIVVETQNTSSGEKVNRTVEFDGAIGQMFDFSVVSKTVDGIISGALEMYGGATTVMAGAVIATEGSVVSGGAALPVGTAIFAAGSYQTCNGLMEITNAIAGRGVDMYKQQDLVKDICKSTGNSLVGASIILFGNCLCGNFLFGIWNYCTSHGC